MKITALYFYPIKALRGIELQTAKLGPRGIQYDRHFMLYKVKSDGSLKKMQLSAFPHCSLFGQAIVGDEIVVTFDMPTGSGEKLRVPLEPEITRLEKLTVDLHGSPTEAYRMGPDFDTWFSARFEFEAILVYIGDGQRAVLGSMSPRRPQPRSGYMSALTSYLVGSPAEQPAWLTFTDVAPYLVTTQASLRNVQSRLSTNQDLDIMYKFRPNIVVEGENEWDEDFWAELVIEDRYHLLLTANCGRCSSVNVDYQTGKQAEGELGTVLKKLMKDRRVDKGYKWSPIFGRYAFLYGEEEAQVAVGDEIKVTERRSERTVWDWPGLG